MPKRSGWAGPLLPSIAGNLKRSDKFAFVLGKVQEISSTRGNGRAIGQSPETIRSWEKELEVDLYCNELTGQYDRHFKIVEVLNIPEEEKTTFHRGLSNFDRASTFIRLFLNDNCLRFATKSSSSETPRLADEDKVKRVGVRKRLSHTGKVVTIFQEETPVNFVPTSATSDRSRQLDHEEPMSTPKYDRTLTVSGAANYVGLSISTLNKLRCTGSGPVYFKLGRAVR
jgi:hypothetical protein